MTDEDREREERQLKYINFLVVEIERLRAENKILQHDLDVAQWFLDGEAEAVC